MIEEDGENPAPAPLALLVAMQVAVSAASLVVEIVAGRMLAPYVGMSLYTWTSVIAVVLAGFSAGHWAGGRIAEARPARALGWTGAAMAAAALSTAGAVFLLRALSGPVIGWATGPVAAIVTLTGLVFFLPSFFAGVPAPVLAQIAVTGRRATSGRALGAIFAAGALGAIAGTLAAGFLFLSWLGSTGTLAAVTAIYAVLAALAFGLARPAGMALAPAVAAVLLPLALAGAALARPDPCNRESAYFCVRVIEAGAEPGAERLMVLDHLVHGISARDQPRDMLTYHAAALEALARARMADRPFAAFFIGGGNYAIPRAWQAAGLDADITVAEIDPAVTATARESFWFEPGERVRILHEDARAALARRPDRYDVIVGDAFTDIAIPPHLVTREFFELVRARLTADGVYLMNVIDHQDRLVALAALATTLGEVFPVVEVWTDPDLASQGNRRVFILVAGAGPTAQSGLIAQSSRGFRVARLSARGVARITAAAAPVILTDDYAPIDRLMGTGDWGER